MIPPPPDAQVPVEQKEDVEDRSGSLYAAAHPRSDLFEEEPLQKDTVIDVVENCAQWSMNEGELPPCEVPRTVSIKIPNWKVLWGVLMTNGSHKLAKLQHQSMRLIAEVLRRDKGSVNQSW